MRANLPKEIQMLVEAVAVAEQDASDGNIKTKTVRVISDLVAKLKVIEAAEELDGKDFKTIPYLDKLLRAYITADYEKALAKLKKAK